MYVYGLKTMRNPYLLDLPLVVSFSGGRTSGFMLKHILDAHGGQPEDLVVTFQNTGLEHPATYQFLEDVAGEWDVKIAWLEYALDGDGRPGYKCVSPDKASRNGEPFDRLIEKKGWLPSVYSRFCTTELKINTFRRFIQKEYPRFGSGFGCAVGLRYDEPRRAMRLKADKRMDDPNLPGGDVEVPLYDAKHTEEDVLAWWGEQPFDLGLPLRFNRASNCVGCFLKGRGKIERLMIEMPEQFDWWVRAESRFHTKTGQPVVFRRDATSYAAMLDAVRSQGLLFPLDGEDTIPCMCTD